MSTYKLINGDCIAEMKKMDANSIDSIVTDPPYEIGFMGKGWDNTGIAYNKKMWAEALRVLKPGGHMLAFSSTRTYHRMVCAIEDSGFEIRDQLAWIYGSGFPKSQNVGKKVKEYDGWGTALKPAQEPIVLARKPLSEKTVAANVTKYGTGAIDIDASRVATGTDDIPSAGNRTATFGTQETISGGDGSGGYIANNKGRWPANIIHDGSEEVMELFPEAGNGWKKNYGEKDYKGKQYKGGTFGGGGYLGGSTYNDNGSAARFFYCAKANKQDRNDGWEEITAKSITNSKGNGLGRVCNICSASILKPCDCENNSWILPVTNKNNHPTVKPTALMQYLVRMITPVDGTVLDPFNGSGSTGKAAMLLKKYNYIGIDLSADYISISKARIENAINTTGKIIEDTAEDTEEEETNFFIEQ
jgi:site-specific DNA-methyltransferase (adenine-specific)